MNTIARAALTLAGTALCASTAPPPASAQRPPALAPSAPIASTPAQAAPAAPTLADLSFMSGCWRGDFDGGNALEEYYSAPAHNMIVGASRFMRGASVVQHEFSRITADSSGIALLPFPNGVRSEHAFRLTSIDDTSALFEAPQHDFPKRIRYTLAADGSLTARIDGGEGDQRVQEWRMQAVSCRAGNAP